MTTVRDNFSPWIAPTGDNWPLVRVIPGERTCACGETFVGAFCERCGVHEDGAQHGRRRAEPPPSVPTLAYLRAGEYVEVR